MMKSKKCTEYKKKNILIMLFLFVGVIVLLILFIPKQKRNIGQLETEGPNCGITLSLKRVKPSGLTLVCTQSGGELTGRLMTNFEYSVQVLENGEWVNVPTIKKHIYTSGQAYFIPMDDRTKLKINWEWRYGKLTPGTYRILYEFEDYRGPGDYDTATYFAEFKIR